MSQPTPPGWQQSSQYGGSTPPPCRCVRVEFLGMLVGVMLLLLLSTSLVLLVRRRMRRVARERMLQAAVGERLLQHRGLVQRREPLPEEICNSLPVSVFRGEDCVLEDRTCAICLVEYEEREELLTLPCKHTFHKGCVIMWFGAHSTCPICRLSLHPSQVPEEEEQAVPEGNLEAPGRQDPDEAFIDMLREQHDQFENSAAFVDTRHEQQDVQISAAEVDPRSLQPSGAISHMTLQESPSPASESAVVTMEALPAAEVTGSSSRSPRMDHTASTSSVTS